MDKATFDNYVTTRYEEQMTYYAKNSRENREKYKKFQWTLIILSALTPVLAALDGVHLGSTDDSPILNIKLIVVVVSAIVAILTTGLKTFNYYELWVNYRNTREELKREIHLYNFGIGPYGEKEVDKESLFVTRVEAILDKEHGQWPPAKKLQEEQNKPKPPEQEVSQVVNEEENNSSDEVEEGNENPEEQPK